MGAVIALGALVAGVVLLAASSTVPAEQRLPLLGGGAGALVVGGVVGIGALLVITGGAVLAILGQRQ